jgi:sec-independent protein translocase protein TatA
MFGGHLPELVIVLVLALVVFGPKRLPEIGGAVGKSIREFRKSTSDLHEGFEDTRLPDTPTSVAPTTPVARERDAG